MSVERALNYLFIRSMLSLLLLNSSVRQTSLDRVALGSVQGCSTLGLFSVKSDVYSFGVLMLEIVSGQKNSSFSKSEHATNLVGYAWRVWNEDRAIDLADKAMGDSVSTHEVLRCIHVGLLCVQDKAADRPLMSSVCDDARKQHRHPHDAS